MPNHLDVQIREIPKTTEGHIFNATLHFKGMPIWGPISCHDNAVLLMQAIRDGDPRFEFHLEKKEHTVEGHTREIIVEVDGEELERLSVHDNMDRMVEQIHLMQEPYPQL